MAREFDREDPMDDIFTDLPFSDPDMHHFRNSTPSMIDSDEDNIAPSQIGRDRSGAPSPDRSPPRYSSLFVPHDTSDQTSSVPDIPTLKQGDALVCEWSEQAYSHIFLNTAHPTYWSPQQTWTDPDPAPLPTRRKPNIDLDDCLDEFAREEQLGQDDLWYCPRCKEHRQAKKTLQLWRVPDIFAVHLKRFSANRGWRDKLDNLIEFPLEGLDLTDRVGDRGGLKDGERLIYDLFAVDNHFGGLGGGHYNAYAQNFVDGKWYCFDGTPTTYLG
jgi:ubiquitin carboxyl-terminal hydrolase 4/11/15